MSERSLHPDTKAAFAENLVRPALLVYADFPDLSVRIWSGEGPLYLGGYTWEGVGGLLAVEDITETTDSAQQGIAVRLSGIPSALFTSVTLGDYQNRTAEVALVLFDSDMALIGDPVSLFRGLMDHDAVNDDGQQVAVTIQLVSSLSDQLKARAFRYTHEDQQTLYPAAADKGLEFVAALQNIEIRWGQA